MNTEIQLPVAELKQALPGFSKIIGRKSSLPVLGCIRVIRDRLASVSLQATNLEDFATFTLGSSNGPPVDVLVPLEQLLRVTRGCPANDHIQLRQKEDSCTLAYPIGPSLIEQKIELFDLKEWPKIPMVDQDSATVGGDFKSALKAAFDCASADSTRYVLNSAFLDVSNPQAHYIIGTDGRQLFSANSFAFDLKASLIVPCRPFLLWKGFLDDGDWRLSIQGPENEDDGWVNFQSNRWNLITKQIAGQYPNWRGAIPAPEGKQATVVLNPEAVEMLLNVIPKLPGNDDVNQPVVLNTSSKGEFSIQARPRYEGDVVTVPIEGATVRGIPFSIHLKRSYLLKALRWGLAEIEFYDDRGAPVIFKSPRQRLIVMPMRGGDSPVPSPQANTSDPQINPPAQVQSSSPDPENQPQEEPQNMKTTNRIAQTENTQTENSPGTPPSSAFKTALEQVEKIKDTLKGVAADLGDLMKTLSQAQKEKRASEKEIESIRASLQSLQRMKI
jgi:DNA polymerase III sliding clamp (beta) subunit (PCNA family)